MATDFCSCSRRVDGCILVVCGHHATKEHGQKDKLDRGFNFFRDPKWWIEKL